MTMPAGDVPWVDLKRVACGLCAGRPAFRGGQLRRTCTFRIVQTRRVMSIILPMSSPKALSRITVGLES